MKINMTVTKFYCGMGLLFIWLCAIVTANDCAEAYRVACGFTAVLMFIFALINKGSCCDDGEPDDDPYGM